MTRAHGIGLPSVLALLALTALASLLVVRLLWLQERMLKLDGERVRNRAWAEAVLELAMQDLSGSTADTAWTDDTRHRMGEPAQSHVFYPTTFAELAVLRQRLAGRACREGICVSGETPAAGQALSATPLSLWQARTADGWPVPAAALPDAAVQAWYWVEVWADAQDLAVAEPAPRFHYRVTALVQGALSGGRVGWQGLWRRQAGSATTDRNGHWSRWQALDP